MNIVNEFDRDGTFTFSADVGQDSCTITLNEDFIVETPTGYVSMYTAGRRLPKGTKLIAVKKERK